MEIKKILLVDDDANIRAIGNISLSKVGMWEVVLASGGAEGVDLAARERPDVILLDVMMPEMNGLATMLCLQGQESTAFIPVIFMTGKAERHEVARYLELGVVGVITKPFDPFSLPDEICRHVAARP